MTFFSPSQSLDFLDTALKMKVFDSAVQSTKGQDQEYLNALKKHNPTSKNDKEDGFGIGFSIGGFSLGMSGGQLPQWGERVDYNYFLQQAGNILRTNRFMVTLFGPPGTTWNSRAGIYACEEVVISDQKIEAVPYKMNMMPQIMAPYMRDFGGTITLTFRMFLSNPIEERRGWNLNLFGVNLGYPPKRKNDQTYNIEPRKSLLNWQSQIVSFDGDYAGVNYFDNYTQNTSIIVSMLDTSSNVLKNTEFVQVYPIEIGGLNPSWEGQNIYMKQTVTFAFTRIIDGAYDVFVPPEVKERARLQASRLSFLGNDGNHAAPPLISNEPPEVPYYLERPPEPPPNFVEQ